jgi:hypothetical protein
MPSASGEFTKALAGALAGGLGGAVSAFALFPLDVLKTRMQSGEKCSLAELTRKLVGDAGVLGLWNGSLFSALQSLIEKFGYFFGYTLLRNVYRKIAGRDAGVLMTLLIGYGSEWSHLFFTMPLDKVKVMRASRMGTNEPQGLIHCIKGEGAPIFPIWRLPVVRSSCCLVHRCWSQRHGQVAICTLGLADTPS